MTLKELEIGKSAVIKTVGGEGALRQHFSGYGNDSGSGGNSGETCADGRSDGACRFMAMS